MVSFFSLLLLLFFLHHFPFISSSSSSSSSRPPSWLDRYNPIPYPDAVIRIGHARFTVLTPSVIRCEFSPDDTFDDTPTVNILHRRPSSSVPKFTVTKDPVRSLVLTVTTDTLELRYDGTNSPYGFTPEALAIQLKRYPYSTWRPGTLPKGNLHGTIRTLDRVGETVDLTCMTPRDTMTYYAHCEEGLLSTDGWTLIDDSLRPRFDTETDPTVVHKAENTRHSDPEWPWMKGPPSVNIEASNQGRPPVYVDYYFFGHGRYYTEVIQDYVNLAGPVPLLPRYVLGPGFSRWYAWGQEEEYSLLQDGFAAHGLPLDGLSVDMDWHPSYPHGLPNPYNIQVEGWTGYTAYPPLFPDFTTFFAHMKRRGIYVNLNMHPAAGVEFHEATYPAIAREVGIDPSTGQTVPFDISNQTYAVGLFKHVLRPLDDSGLDYWWIDFQHGPFTPVPVLNPTFACNYAWWTNPWRYGHRVTDGLEGSNGKPNERGRDRPFIMGRWGGLGGHRYPIGFAGDTAVKWRILRYETYFSPTSSNVGFMWTHDIGGFEGDPPAELLTRWVQWGTFSAMLRTHSSKLSPARSPWHYPNPYFSVMRTFYRLRTALVPYIAMAQRITYETGMQLLQPMYWSYPYAEATYKDQALHQYFFGPDIWVSPIAAALKQDGTGIMMGAAPLGAKAMRGSTGTDYNATLAQMNGRVTWTLWVPPGDWIEWFSWQSVRGKGSNGRSFGRKDPQDEVGNTGSYIARNYSLGEMPVFSAPGTIIPLRVLPDSTTGGAVLGLSTQPLKDVGLWIFPLMKPNHTLNEPSSTTAAAKETTEKDGYTILHRTITRLYDDDGLSIDYEDREEYYWTNIDCEWRRPSVPTESGFIDAVTGLFSSVGGGSSSSKKRTGGDSIVCKVSVPIGKGYPNFPTVRTYSWRFIGTYVPSKITVNGVTINRDQPAVPDNQGEHSAWKPNIHSWAYHGASLSTWIRIGVPMNTMEEYTVTLQYPTGIELDDPLLTSGFNRKVSRSLICKDDVDRHYGLLYPVDIEPVLNISGAAPRLSAAKNAYQARSILSYVNEDLRQGIDTVTAWSIPRQHTVALTLQAHCMGPLTDAVIEPVPLPSTDTRYKIANRPIKFLSDIANSKGSGAGEVSQVYSGGNTDELEIV